MISGTLIALMMLATNPTASLPLADWLAQIADQSPAELSFVETRESGLLSEPLAVRGRLSHADGQLVRHSQSPRIETHILAETFVEVRREGGYRQRFAISRAPELAALREALLAILEGDIERLSAHFEIHLRHDDDAWSLLLEPLEAHLADRVSSLELTGQADQIESLEMILADGERILTRFEDAP